MNTPDARSPRRLVPSAPQRYYGVAHLLVASLFGGAAACCVLLGRDERLRAQPRTPWELLGWACFAAESTLLLAWAQWDLRLPRAASMALLVLPILLLCGICHVRYRAERRQFPPAVAQEAAAVGWMFCALRLAMFATAAWLRVQA